MFLQVSFDVANFKHKVQSLQWVQDVNYIMEWVFLKITLLHLPSETDKRLQLNVCKFEKAVDLEYLVN